MNRVVSRKLAGNVHGLRILWRNFCNDAAAKASSSNEGILSTETNGHQYDIAIIGGGMVGMALACSLVNTPLTKHLNVAIIDNNPALGRRPCVKKEDIPDPRVSMLKKYEAERKAANITMIALLDGFQKAYSLDFGPLNIL